MFIKIQYQCYNSDEGKSMDEGILSQFIKKRDSMFEELLKEIGYDVSVADYDYKTGVRELFFIKVVNA